MSINIIEAFATANKCYQVAIPLYPLGIMLHSVGTPQPSAAVFARNFNQYQPGGASVCVHAFAQADGTVYQTLPWEMHGWHCGAVSKPTPARPAGSRKTRRRCGRKSARHTTERSTIQYRTAEIWRWNPESIICRTM